MVNFSKYVYLCFVFYIYIYILIFILISESLINNVFLISDSILLLAKLRITPSNFDQINSIQSFNFVLIQLGPLFLVYLIKVSSSFSCSVL